MNKFAALSGEMRRMIEAGSLRYGEKLPSVRMMARSRRLSMTTVITAYRELEAIDLIEARPRSGYYVKFDASLSQKPRRALRVVLKGLDTYRDLMPELLAEADQGAGGNAVAVPPRHRYRADGSGSRIDMRSLSRQGRSDFGVNAARIGAYMGELKRRAG